MRIFNRFLYIVMGIGLTGFSAGLWLHEPSLAGPGGIATLVAFWLGVTTEDGN